MGPVECQAIEVLEVQLFIRGRFDGPWHGDPTLDEPADASHKVADNS